MSSRRIGVRIRPAVHAKLRAISEREQRPMGEIVDDLIARYYQSHRPESDADDGTGCEPGGKSIRRDTGSSALPTER